MSTSPSTQSPSKPMQSVPMAPLTLDPKHPGIADPNYVERRGQLYKLAYEYRVAEAGWPTVEYTDAEHALWRAISERLIDCHRRRACALYNDGKRLLQIESRHMPQLGDLDAALRQRHGFGLVPAEGLIDVELFFRYLQSRRMPCTQFLRHHAVPEFTPEPDAVHDVLGHVPCLVDAGYTRIVQQMGEGILAATPETKDYWSRLYWFTVEFGLIEEKGEVKVFGAGLLSSVQEMDYTFSDGVHRRPFVLEEVIHTAYDPSRMQDTVFVIQSLPQLAQDVALLRQRTDGH